MDRHCIVLKACVIVTRAYHSRHCSSEGLAMTYLKSCDVEGGRDNRTKKTRSTQDRNNDAAESQILLEDDNHKVCREKTSINDLRRIIA